MSKNNSTGLSRLRAGLGDRFCFADRQGLQFELMGDCEASGSVFAFARFKQIGELLDSENALFLILPLHACCNAVQQAKVILLLGLRWHAR